MKKVSKTTKAIAFISGAIAVGGMIWKAATYDKQPAEQPKTAEATKGPAPKSIGTTSSSVTNNIGARVMNGWDTEGLRIVSEPLMILSNEEDDSWLVGKPKPHSSGVGNTDRDSIGIHDMLNQAVDETWLKDRQKEH